YDHTLQDAFSRVLHKLIDSLPYLEGLLNVFCSNTSCPKAFLFDIRSRLYVATDASPVDQATHNLCCDYLQMLNSFGPLYKSAFFSPTSVPYRATNPELTSTDGLSSLNGNTTPHSTAPPKPLNFPSASASLTPSHPGTTLTYHLVTPHLALLALLPTTVYDMRRGLVEWNVVWLREGVREIWEVEKERCEGDFITA
ncbi:hypothetical protein ID866_11712, partial [Astraeus odoratus]